MVPGGSDERGRRQIAQGWGNQFELYTKSNNEPLKSLKQKHDIIIFAFFQK